MAKERSSLSGGSTGTGGLLYERAATAWQEGHMKRAFKSMLAAANAGVVAAFTPVAQFYDFGDGVKPDEERALYWYGRAYRHGDYSAANNIGCIWRDRGQVARAIHWFKRAESLGDGDASLNIAKVFLEKHGELASALRYLRKTARSVRATEGSREEASLLLRKLKDCKDDDAKLGSPLQNSDRQRRAKSASRSAPRVSRDKRRAKVR